MDIDIPFDPAALVASLAAGVRHEFLFFWGHRKAEDGCLTKSCFSQWWEAPFCMDGRQFRTAEHYMMTRKAELFGDHETAALVLAAETPKAAKALGRKVRGFSEDAWLAHREEIVFTGNMEKFSQNADLREFLLGTRDAVLVEASPVDSVWGIGLAEADPKARNPAEWPGLNLLGFALTRVREKLRQRNVAV